MCLPVFRVKKPMRLVYHVISCDGLGGSIACVSNSQMASTLSQIRVACNTMKMASFRMKRNTLSCVSCIATVPNNSYSLHSATILTHYRVLHILFSETQHCYSEMTSEANSSQSPLFLGREHGNVQNYEL